MNLADSIAWQERRDLHGALEYGIDALFALFRWATTGSGSADEDDGLGTFDDWPIGFQLGAERNIGIAFDIATRES